MVKLAEYLADLSILLGSLDHVHFVRVGAGSAKLIQKADPNALRNVKSRLRSVSTKRAPEDAQGAFDRINALLMRDSAVADIRTGKAKILVFPGRETIFPEIFGPVSGPDYLDGELIRVGGGKETIPVHLREEGTIYRCTTNVEMARSLAPHLYGPPIRVFGNASWIGNEAAGWELQQFFVEHFTLLADRSLREALSELEKLPSPGWRHTALEEIRSSGSKV